MLTIAGRPPQGWPLLERCARLALDHPEWTADQVERRALAMQACNVDTEDALAAKLRRPRAAATGYPNRREVIRR